LVIIGIVRNENLAVLAIHEAIGSVQNLPFMGKGQDLGCLHQSEQCVK
jgi:hypothetical protein